MPFFLKILFVMVGCIVILRLFGNRAIGQMTVPELALTLLIGPLLIIPTNPNTIWEALVGGVLLVIVMILAGTLQRNIPGFGKWVNGVPLVLIKDGTIDPVQIQKARMSVDSLEMRLRQLKVENVTDVKTAVLETSGELTVLLQEKKKPATKEDIEQIITLLQSQKQPAGTSTLFTEAQSESNAGQNFNIQ